MRKKLNSQCERLVAYMEEHAEGITQMEALDKLGIFRLASRIADLKDDYLIIRENVTVINRFGEECRVKRYRLPSQEELEGKTKMSDSKRYYWLRFQKDFFTSLRIKKLRKLAGGDTFTIIYLKMQLLSITDGGHLHYKGYCKSFVEEIAEDIDEEIENVSLTVSYLLSTGLMVQNENDYYLPYAAENIGSETAGAQRVRDYRSRQKALHCNNNVQSGNAIGCVEKEKEKEKEIYINTPKSKNKFNQFEQQNYDMQAIEEAMENENNTQR